MFLFELPVIITEPGKYLTRKGEVVDILTTTRRSVYKCGGNFSCGTYDYWMDNGRRWPSRENDHDVVGRYTEGGTDELQ